MPTSAADPNNVPPPAPGPPERRLPVPYAALFYAIPAAIAWAWLGRGRSRALWAPPDWAADLARGVAAGLAIAGLALLAGRRFRWARRLEAEFGSILGAQKGWEIVVLALLSGFAEEYFFRGALQEKFGIWIPAAVFALLHWPLNRAFLPWPFLAGAIGLGLGGLRIWTDSLLAPAAAHAVVNLVNLARITRRFSDGDAARAEACVRTGKGPRDQRGTGRLPGLE